MTETRDRRRVVGVVAASHFVNHTYLMLLPAVIGAAAAAFGVSLATIGLAIGVQGAMMAAFQLPFGYLSDARSRELVLGVCLVLGSFGALAVALAPSFAWLVVGEGLLGIGVAGHHPAHYPMLREAVADESRGRAFSVHGFAGNVGFAAPFALAPVVLSMGGSWRTYAGIVGVAGLVFAVGAIVYVHARVGESILVPGGEVDGSIRERFATMLGGLRDPAIVSLALLAGLAAGAGWALRTYTATLLNGSYGIPDARASLLVSAMIGVAAIVILGGGVLADRRRPGRVLVSGFLLLAALSLLLASKLLPALAASVVVLGYNGTLSVTTPSRSKLTDTLSARTDVGKNFALVTIGISGGATFAPPVFGYLVETFGPAVAFDGVAAVAVGAAIIAFVVTERYA